MKMISIVDILEIMKKYYMSGMLLCVIGIGAGIIYNNFAIPTTYINNAKFYVDTRENVETDELDLEYIVAAQQVVATYIEIFKSDKVLNQVKENISAEYTCEQLADMIKCDSINHTAIMETEIESNDPNISYEINKYLLKFGEEEANRVIGNNRMTVIDEPVLVINPIKPDKKMYILTGVIVSLGIWVAYIVFRERNTLNL